MEPTQSIDKEKDQIDKMKTDEPEPEIIDKDTFRLEQNFFGGKLKGFNYFTLVFKNGTDEEAKSSLKKMSEMWESKAVVSLVNSSIKSSQRIKATNEIKSLAFDKIAARLNTNPCLYSSQQAEEYKPGEKEKSIQMLTKDLFALRKEGDKKGAMAIWMQIQEMIMRENEDDGENIESEE